jgi:hypothetical protein
VQAFRQLADGLVDQRLGAAGTDLLAQQRAGSRERHVDGGVADLLGRLGFGLGDAVERLLFAQGDRGFEVGRGLGLHAGRFVAGLLEDGAAFRRGLGQRAIGIGLGFQGVVAQLLGIGERLGDGRCTAVEQFGSFLTKSSSRSLSDPLN